MLDYDNTHYTNGNDFNFQAVGAVLVARLGDLRDRHAAGHNDVKFLAKAQGLGPAAVPMVGKGNDEAVFVKAAIPIAYGISADVPLSHETWQFDATTLAGQPVKWETDWRPSGGFGVAWGTDGRKDP